MDAYSPQNQGTLCSASLVTNTAQCPRSSASERQIAEHSAIPQSRSRLFPWNTVPAATMVKYMVKNETVPWA
jgi:hypothetical protein